tara:strand:- start:5432 stop:6595 length:1164 start_codon:yes stop_codon:yes gene_type:complete
MIQNIREQMPIIIVMASVLLALFMSNSAFHADYEFFVHSYFGILWDDNLFKKPLHLWVNEGLMSVFFFQVVLEIRHELMFGSLKSMKAAMSPIIGAMGGIVVPAGIYLVICGNNTDLLRGWAIPTATDIVFGLAFLDLIVSRQTKGYHLMRVLLLSIAVVDDLIGIFIIAVYYSQDIHGYFISLSCILIITLMFLRQIGVTNRYFYTLVGLITWIMVMNSGVHATMAGVVVGMIMPFKNEHELENLHDQLNPIVTYFIIPLFAFFNAGVNFSDASPTDIFNPLVLGVMLGLWVGKPLGVYGFMRTFTALGILKLPDGLLSKHILTVGFLSGVGFTISLFIGSLAFEEAMSLDNHLKMGILYGSLLSVLSAWIYWTFRGNDGDRIKAV